MNKDLQLQYIEMAKEITVAKLTGSSAPASSLSGSDTAAFLQLVYAFISPLRRPRFSLSVFLPTPRVFVL